MAQLKDTLIQGSARITDTLYATTLKGNLNLDYIQDAADLKAIEALTGTAGFLKKTAANTWSLDNSTYSKTDTHVNVSLAGAAISHNYILMTSTAPTSTAAAHTALGATSIWVNSADKGKFELVLGNSTATSSSGGQYGQLALYSTNTAGTYLKAADGTSWKTATLQAKDGTIALTSDIPTNLNQLTNGPGYITASSNITGTAANVTGTVAVAHGGTGVTSFTNDCVVVATGTTQTLVSRGLKVTGATDANVTVQSNTSGKHLYINSPGGAADINISTAANSGSGILYLISGNTMYINKPASASIVFTSDGADTSHEKGRFNTNGMFQLNSSVAQSTHKLLVNGDSAFTGKLAFIGTPAATLTENASIQYINSGLFYRGTILTGTGTAAAGNSTNGYTGALWKFNLSIATPNDGDKITIRVPIASHDYGTYISLDNGTTYRAVGINGGTTRLTGQYPVDSIVTLVYDADGTIASLFPPVTPATSRASSNTTNIPGVGCWRVVNYYDSGNTNDSAGYMRQMQNGAYRKTSAALYRYKILLPHSDGIHAIPANTTNIQNNTDYPFSTAMTTITTAEFDITRPIEYYNSTTTLAADANIDGRYHWFMYSGVDLRYSFNTGTTLTAGKDVYLVATLQAGGLTAKLRNPGATGTNAAATATGANAGPITQVLPTSDDGFIYIKLGNAYNTAAIILTSEHPIYQYKDGALRPFTPIGAYPTGSAAKCLTEAGTWASFSNLTLGSTAGAALSNTASAGSATTAAKSDHVHPLPTAADIGAAAGSHSHGNITSTGCTTTAITIAAGDYLIVGDNDKNGKIGKGPAFVSTTANKFLKDTGSFTTIAAADLPAATTSDKGAVIVGSGLAVSNGTISIDGINTSSGSTTKCLTEKGTWERKQLYYGTCETAAGTSLKEVICAEYDKVLTIGDMVVVKFTNTNSATTSGLQLTIKNTSSDTAGTAAANIKKQMNASVANLSQVGELRADTIAVFIYNGTYWILINCDYNSNNNVTQNIATTTDGLRPVLLSAYTRGTGITSASSTIRSQNVYVDTRNDNFYATAVHNAVWNDYAEYRRAKQPIAPGRVIIDTDEGAVVLATRRLQPGAQIVSDTWGHIMGETSDAKTPVAVAGRVLVYPYRDRNEYHAGMSVCSAPDGTVDIMSDEEIRNFSNCIIGYVSEIPNYETWGSGNVKVDGRIWVRVK